ncbi:hypothetical protein L249_3157 [Ophiocordyceps polyrhachis-furcata BCC 54312]|uniref:Uncharacterized protein n=1 Tax=Ophiocordyceps polyrhachis-furcata BCC 54312 TaxID=1330021 RepID=A0A367LS46_9HYPO|nr:hypothetical protein L249_3157 [Ophiocordyceps polyrhachis-furcata BCC 54312]
MTSSPSPSPSPLPPEDVASKAVVIRLRDWGSSSLPPMLLATLVTALHARPLQIFPLALFTPTLLFASYLNLAGFPTNSAGVSAAWSGAYAMTALRRRQPFREKLTARGAVRGVAIALGALNFLAGGVAYLAGDSKRDERERLQRNRWGGEDSKT